AYFFILQQVDHGHSINLDLLRRIQKLYPQGLLNGRPDDPNTVASVIKYVGERMPTQIFRSNLKAIHFTNSTSEIMDVVHVSRAPGRVKRRKFAPNRSRWYVRNEIDEKHLELTFHVRDVLLQDPSDAFEMLSWLGSLEQARESVIAMIERGEDISPIKIAFRDLYTKHIQSEIEMLRKKKVAIKNIDKELTLSINFRLEELFERMKNLDSLSAELLVEWLSDERGEVVICQAHSNQKTLGGISGIKEPNAAEMTLGAAKETIEKEGLETPTDILFGNDFSMRIFLSIGLFSDQEFEYLKKTFESKKEKIQSSLDKLENQDVREAAEKFFLIQQLSQYTQGDLVMQGLRERLFSPETFEKIGIKRLVATVDSPIADPVDLIDLTKIGPEICNNLPKFLQEIILQLRENNRVILSVPYTLGNLANTTLEAAVKTFPSLDSENFIGKVGLFSTGTDDVSVGDVVLSNQVFSQFEGAGRPVENSIAPLITQYGYPVRIGSLLTTAGLTFQESAEMAAMHGNDPESKIYLDMEAAHLQDALANLSLDSNHVYYVSDKTRDPNSFDHQLHAGEKISESLGARGSIPLFICLLAVLENIGHGK
nr:hypothetical protein [Candidatus Woesebacteria bacterium]